MRDRRLEVTAVALLAACSLTSPTPSVEPRASVREEASECPPVDLRSPSGSRVALTGVWRSNDLGVYTIHQDRSCLYWIGMSYDPGSEPGEFWTNVFVGTVQGDFTVVGRWGDVPYHPNHELERGTMTLRIDFDQSGGSDYPVLREIASTGPFGGSVWVLEESLSAETNLDGIFGGNVAQECNWIESNGERYELIVGGEWVIRPVPLSLQTGDGRILARVGDPIRVRGRLSGGLGSGCTEQAILVEELDPSP